MRYIYFGLDNSQTLLIHLVRNLFITYVFMCVITNDTSTGTPSSATTTTTSLRLNSHNKLGIYHLCELQTLPLGPLSSVLNHFNPSNFGVTTIISLSPYFFFVRIDQF